MSAIDAPLCRLCQKPHWGWQPHDFGPAPKAKPISLPAPAKASKAKKRKKQRG